jgi:hypothetical protein
VAQQCDDAQVDHAGDSGIACRRLLHQAATQQAVTHRDSA